MRISNTLSRPSDNEAYDITQEDLVVASLRFNPDIVVVGEMRDTEAYSAVEASLTGHTVVSTIHASAADAAHMRLALLCQKRFPIDFAYEYYYYDIDYGADEYFNSTYQRVQLGEKMWVTISKHTYVKGLGVFKIPVTVSVTRSGLSEKYWK